MAQHSRPASPLADNVFRSWLRTIGLFRRTMEPFFADFGITGAQWAILHCLHRADAGGEAEIRMADLGERLLIRPPSVTSVVQRAEQMGLVVARAAANDHRVKCVALTAEGRLLVRRILSRHQAQVQRMFECFNTQEQSTLEGLLARLADHLSAIEPAS